MLRGETQVAIASKFIKAGLKRRVFQKKVPVAATSTCRAHEEEEESTTDHGLSPCVLV